MISIDSVQLLVPVDRGRALLRGILWAVPAAALMALSVPIYSNLDFTPSPIASRLVNYAFALLASPLPIVGLWSGFQAVRWLSLVAWPGTMGVYAGANKLILHLGSFGNRTFDARRLKIRYPFELLEEGEGEGSFEAYLPEEEQLDRFIPRIQHPQSKEPINRTILKFAKGTESQVAASLRPTLDRWRNHDQT